MRTPTQRAREADANALIKFVLTQLDEVATLPPELANEPYALEERKKAIKRKVWEFYRNYAGR